MNIHRSGRRIVGATLVIVAAGSIVASSVAQSRPSSDPAPLKSDEPRDGDQRAASRNSAKQGRGGQADSTADPLVLRGLLLEFAKLRTEGDANLIFAARKVKQARGSRNHKAAEAALADADKANSAAKASAARQRTLASAIERYPREQVYIARDKLLADPATPTDYRAALEALSMPEADHEQTVAAPDADGNGDPDGITEEMVVNRRKAKLKSVDKKIAELKTTLQGLPQNSSRRKALADSIRALRAERASIQKLKDIEIAGQLAAEREAVATRKRQRREAAA
jgi:hypothetical protein